jgi:hypothetical protein
MYATTSCACVPSVAYSLRICVAIFMLEQQVTACGREASSVTYESKNMPIYGSVAHLLLAC